MVALAFRAILEPAGTVNQFLQLIGLDAVRWLTDKRFALMTCIVADIWKGIGTVTIILIAGICAIPQSYYEAAAIDGCGIYGCFFRIALPLCRTGFFVSGLMTFINNWNELLLAMVFISDPMKKTLPVTLTYFVGPYATSYVQMFAAIIIAIAPTVVVYSLFSNQIVEGLTAGAVKG